MNYISTRSDDMRCTAAEAILRGIAPDGGLLVPETIPVLSADEVAELKRLSYPERVALILEKFLDDYESRELEEYCTLAYGEEKFGEQPCPLVQLNPYDSRKFMLELWHGPTAAFKDMALQLLPHLMSAAAKKCGGNREIAILTATSGDTGKAALEGFSDVAGTQVIVFYPVNGVAPAQALQMKTSSAANCHVLGIEGSFDDAQNGVKALFADEDFAACLQRHGKVLSSANSINWGRLASQIAYYWSAYADLLTRELIEPGEEVNFCVPTGNFGNILAAWYASQMGLPVHKLICASNRNNVLTDFLHTGTYNSKRHFYRTNTPSMDILISSNLERLLHALSYQNATYVQSRMESLASEGCYTVGPEMLNRLREKFVGGYADEQGVLRTILDVYDDCDHLVDPHTAVAFNVYKRYVERTADTHPVVYVATASPFKFPETIARALFPRRGDLPQEYEALLALISAESGMEIPAGLQGLAGRTIYHETTVKPDQMKAAALGALDIEGDSSD